MAGWSCSRAARDKTLNIFSLQDSLEYRRKMRLLKVRMLDGTVKSLMVDDSQTVNNLMVLICTKIGITNHDEYSLVWDKPDEEQENIPTNRLVLNPPWGFHK